MSSTRANSTTSNALAARLKEAIESERYQDAMQLMVKYSACVAELYRSGNGEAAPEKQVMELMQWAQRALVAARAHASDQFQLLSDSRVYSAEDTDRNTFQIML